jgi:hypothetical protein
MAKGQRRQLLQTCPPANPCLVRSDPIVESTATGPWLIRGQTQHWAKCSGWGMHALRRRHHTL